MPLFVFISGYFTKVDKTNKIFFKKLLRLLETLVVFNVLFHAMDIIRLDFSFLWTLTPSWILWYILSLIYWRLFVKFTPPPHTRLQVVVNH